MKNLTYLAPIEILQGSLTTAFVLISLALGFIIISKYFTHKDRQSLYVGITIWFLVSPYWSDAISFIMFLTTGNELDTAINLFIARAFTAPILIPWIIAFTDFLYKEKQKIIVRIVSIIAITYEIIFLIIYFIDYNLIGRRRGPFVAEFAHFIGIFLMCSIIFLLTTGFLFIRESLRSDSKEIRLQGKFLLITFIAFGIWTIIDILFKSPYGSLQWSTWIG
ncbi:MAG: hypothetical protein ACE5I5_13025 [Candidatus Heimdallarchaeota archaeon]